MRAGFLVMFVLAAAPQAASAQQPPPMPSGPASLNVPHPIPPISTTPGPPRDLYQQLTPPAPPPTIIYVPSGIYGPYGLFGQSFYPGYAGWQSTPTLTLPPVPAIVEGSLRFESSPGAAQVFVDGAYVGLIEDFGIYGRALVLEQGAHHVDLRAAGYAPLSFDINIAPNQTLRYRGDLQRMSSPQGAALMPGPPGRTKITYVIPNCYAGDRPPAIKLPSGCNVGQMKVRKP